MAFKIKWVWFDADNTLWRYDKDRAYKRMFSHISSRYNLEESVVEKEYWNVVRDVSKSLDPRVRRRNYSLCVLLRKFGLNFSEEEVECIVDVFVRELVKSLKPVEGIHEFLTHFKDKMDFGIFSEEFRDFLVKKLDRFNKNWRSIFKSLVTPDITGVMKPSPKYYEKILEISRVSSENIMVVGDSWEKDLKIAKEFGMKTILISRDGKVVGEPDYVIKNYQELSKILQDSI